MLQTILKKALRICSPITLFAFLVYCYLKRRNFLGSFQKQSTLVQSKKIITISTKNILLWNASSDPTQPIIAFKESAIAFLKSLLKTSDWSPILISVISSDQEEVAIQQLLHSTGLYSNGLDPKKVLFCSTKEGVVHITRHINPKLHMDTNVDTVAALAPHLTRCIYVQNSKMDSFHNELRRSSSSLNDFPHTTTANSLDQVDLTNQSTSVDLGASESPKTRVSSPTIDPKLKSINTINEDSHTIVEETNSANKVAERPAILNKQLKVQSDSLKRRASYRTLAIKSPTQTKSSERLERESDIPQLLVGLKNVVRVVSLSDCGLIE